MEPHRIQLSRAKGWRMPANASKVDRTTRWGNPFVVPGSYPAQSLPAELINSLELKVHDSRNGPFVAVETPAQAVGLFGWWIMADAQQAHRDLVRANLKGRNLACWCKLGFPCHADLLLEIANR